MESSEVLELNAEEIQKLSNFMLVNVFEKLTNLLQTSNDDEYEKVSELHYLVKRELRRRLDNF